MEKRYEVYRLYTHSGIRDESLLLRFDKAFATKDDAQTYCRTLNLNLPTVLSFIMTLNTANVFIVERKPMSECMHNASIVQTFQIHGN